MPISFRLSLLAAILISGLTSVPAAEAPGLESLYPAGGRAGDRIEVKVLGKGLDKNDPHGWCSNPAVTLQPVPLTGDKAKDKALAGLWHITIAKDAAPGPCLIRFHNNDGSSPPHIFEIGTHPELTEQEPNDSFKESSSSSPKEAPPSPTTSASPQSSSIANPPATPGAANPPATPSSPSSLNVPTAPFTLNGLFAKEGDADTFPIRVRKGIPLTFELHGYALGSSMDPAMRLLDDRGIELAASHDTHNLDPLIRHTPTADTTLHIQLFAFVHPPQSDIAFKGTASHIYRLHVTEALITPSSPTTSNNAPASSSSSFSYSSSTPNTPPPPPALNPPPIPASPKSSSSSLGSTLTAPSTTQGFLSTPGQESLHTIHAKKADDLQITVRAKSTRSPLEAVLRIESISPSGEIKVLQTVDDASGIKEAGSLAVLDPALHWKAPADGNYRIVVSDRFQNGSPHHRYELEVKPWQPTVTAILTDHAFLLQPGKTTDIKVAITLDGKFPEKDKLIARATHLPSGVTAAEVELPTKSGELKLTLKAAPDALPSQAPFSIEIFSPSTATPPPPSPDPTPPPPVPAPITLATYPIPFKELRGDLLLPTDTQVWLTVPASPQPVAKPTDKGKANAPVDSKSK